MDNQSNPHEQDTIFNELTTTRKQERNKWITRVLLYGIAVWWLAWAVIYGSRFYRLQEQAYYYSQQVASFLMIESLVLGFVFLVLAILSHKKAVLSFLIAFILYGIISFWFIYTNSFNFPNDLVRIFILLLLVKGYEDARTYEHASRLLGK